MNKTSLPTSLDDTSELKKLIIENPKLPLIIFAGEEAYSGEYAYEMSEAHGISIRELTLYKDYWLDKEDYEEELSDDLCDEDEYKDMPDKEYFKMIKKKVEETEFVKAIVLYVG